MLPQTFFAPHVVGCAPFGHVTLHASTLVQSTMHVPVQVTSHVAELVQLTFESLPAVTVQVLALSQLKLQFAPHVVEHESPDLHCTVHESLHATAQLDTPLQFALHPLAPAAH